MVTELLQKYIWLVQVFVRAGEHGLELSEIQRMWENRWDTEYSRRTFNNHREAIEDVFGIRIECDLSNYRYHIHYSKDVADENAANSWLINTFTVNNLLTQSKDRLSGRVAVEDIPSGHRYLTDVMNAMQENAVLKIDYLKYQSTETSTYTIRPYAVKEHARRWYLVGWCEERESVRVYGMDRIVRIEQTNDRFKLPGGFDVDELFSKSYGVYLPDKDEKPVEILIKASARESKFLKDLPLHATQRIVETSEDNTIFSINVTVNDSLVMDLLSRASRIEVLSPAWLRDRMMDEIKKMSNIYE